MGEILSTGAGRWFGCRLAAIGWLCVGLLFTTAGWSQEQGAAEGEPTVESLMTRIHQTDKQRTDSLASVKKLHDHPLYTMTFYGDYDCQRPLVSDWRPGADTSWACSLFFAYGSGEHPLFGRNFDWQHNPAMLLVTDPSDGYASISMVDVSYLGYSRKDPKFETLEGRENLLLAPMIPFDGMNEHGLTVGMAAVPSVPVQADASKPTVGSLQIIRMILDKARNVDEAVQIVRKYNVAFSGGPQIHYLIADAEGDSVVVEYHDGEFQILDQPSDTWNAATNFHLTGHREDGAEYCRRYAQIEARLKQAEGELHLDSAFRLLKNVAQRTTRWSVVYDMKNGMAHVAMARDFNHPFEFQIQHLEPAAEPANSK